ncbi:MULTISPECIES: hypothetical protein [unclassified Paraburkholderia]|uniref:hypothetical protein n=1 Tax=unclassified Paraburkholderia TaxID=2615204 RepID=UPI002AB2773F|nr:MULTISPECIES: hypothetical protein [unclassified Paraburkholderia]
MLIIVWVLLAILIEMVLAVGLGKILKRAAQQSRPVDETLQHHDSEPYARWYE